MTIEQSAATDPAGRPGCVTIYAILLVIGSFFGLLVLACVVALGTDPRISEMYSLLGINALWFAILLPTVVLSFAAAVGIWLMREWGLWLIYITGGLTLVFSVWQTVNAAQLGTVFNAVSNLITIAIQIVILFWFITNRHLFNGHSEEQPVEITPSEANDVEV